MVCWHAASFTAKKEKREKERERERNISQRSIGIGDISYECWNICCVLLRVAACSCV